MFLGQSLMGQSLIGHPVRTRRRLDNAPMSSMSSMPSKRPSRADILARVKTIMRRDLKLGPDLPIPDDMPFFGGEADIDSLDVLLLLSSVEKEFGIKIPNEAVGRQVFQSVGSLADYLERQ